MDANVNLIEAATANRNNEKGVTTVEYALMLALVAIAVAVGTPGISAAVLGVFSNMATHL